MCFQEQDERAVVGRAVSVVQSQQADAEWADAKQDGQEEWHDEFEAVEDWATRRERHQVGAAIQKGGDWGAHEGQEFCKHVCWPRQIRK